MLDVEFAQLSHPGGMREHNEDYLGCVLPETPAQARTHGWMFALADGVGGQERGEVASHAAVEHLLEGFRSASAGEAHTGLLPRLVQGANAHVYETGMRSGPGGVSMATTLVACALRFNRAVVAHVGDSRCYLIRASNSLLLTRDHTVANEQVRLGLLSGREASQASTRNVLSRCLGTDLFVNVESSEHQIFTGDILVLCSDGLHNSISGIEMAGMLTPGADLNAVAARLVMLANQRDGSDNISIQLIRIRGVERIGMYRGRPYKLP